MRAEHDFLGATQVPDCTWTITPELRHMECQDIDPTMSQFPHRGGVMLNQQYHVTHLIDPSNSMYSISSLPQWRWQDIHQ
jgi:hypothetical protein